MIVTRRRSVSRDLLADSERGHKLTAALAIQNHRQLLTHYEETEILAFRSIYFLGYKSSKIQTSTSLPNLGFDAKNGDMILQEGSHLAYQYEVQQLLGKGSFGQVYKCMDHKVMQNVAVKVVKNKGRYATQADLEVQILQFLAEDPDFANSRCISLLHYFEFRKHKCIAMPLLGQNLYDFKKASGFKKSPASFVRKIAVQLLDCLAFLRKKRVVHCDLKPENILLVNEGEAEVKVIDFGSSCYASETSFTYIQSRFYRSPEVMLGLRYSTFVLANMLLKAVF
jgi:dual specificity tyrosine-phosphorylation-regulated kinase 2/3/4